MDIYIKPVKKAALRGSVTIGDIAGVCAPAKIEKRIKKIKLLNATQNKSYLVSVMDIIAKITAFYPDCTVNNVGECDTVVEYDAPAGHASKLKTCIKVAIVAVLLAAGSATAIMSFHSDAQMSKVFENYYYIFFGKHAENPAIVHLPYSVGLAVGIIVFFNHFTNKKLTSDPTPIEVEMSVYESDVTDNIIDTLNTQRQTKNVD